VSVWLHPADRSDRIACTFWVPPATGLLTYTMRGFATKAWTGASISVFPETAGPETWILLDDVTLRRTPSWPIGGTECFDPIDQVVGGIAVLGDDPAGTSVRQLTSDRAHWLETGAFDLAPEASYGGSGSGWQVEASTTRSAALQWVDAIDLTGTRGAHLHFQSWLSSRTSSGAVQVSLDGLTWDTATSVSPGNGWNWVDVDLGAYAGRRVYVRFVFDGVASEPGIAADFWRIDAVTLEFLRTAASSGTGIAGVPAPRGFRFVAAAGRRD
jgi:hypothetical protein